MDIIYKVPQLRSEAKKSIKEAQEKLEKAFGTHKATQFKKGELVWYYDKAKAERHNTKLENKWKGPYIVSAVLDKGAYKLSLDGKELRLTVNGDLMKRYYGRSDWQPIVMIDQEKL